MTSTLLFAVVVHWSLPGDLSTTADVQQLGGVGRSAAAMAAGPRGGNLPAEWVSVCRVERGEKLAQLSRSAIVLIAYGVLGILLHPEQPTAVQLAKLWSPLPLSLAGGGLQLLRERRSNARLASRVTRGWASSRPQPNRQDTGIFA